jgi:hypothetical protein
LTRPLARFVALLLGPVVLAVAAEPATRPAYRRHEDPFAEKRWAIEVPDDWTAEDRFARRGILQFQSPDRPPLTLTVSSIAGLALPDRPETTMLDLAFPDSEPMSDPQPMRGDGWVGLFRTYQAKDQSSPKNHVGLIAMRDDALVLVTISAEEAMTPEQTKAVAGILARLTLSAGAEPATRPAR